MLEVNVEQTLLSEFILRSVSGGVTPTTIPYMTDEDLAKVHRTPSVACGPPLRSLSRSPGENLSRSQPCVDRKRHGTYILINILDIHGSISIIIVGYYLTRLRDTPGYSNPSVDGALSNPYAQLSIPTLHDHITLGNHGSSNW